MGAARPVDFAAHRSLVRQTGAMPVGSKARPPRGRPPRGFVLAMGALLVVACAPTGGSQGPTAAAPSASPPATSTASPATPTPSTATGASPAAAGPVTLQLREFDVPAGSHPHDVAPAADGGVWYTGQHKGVLGHFDPATGDIREIPLGAGSAPHGVITGPDDAAWITDGGLNAIVRVDGDDRRGPRLRPAGRSTGCEPQHRGLRPDGHAVVHRPVRRVRTARSGDRRDATSSTRPRAAAPTASP